MKNKYLGRLLSVIFLVIFGTGLYSLTEAKKSNYNLMESRILPKSLSYIQKNYVEPERISPKEMLKSGLDEVQRIVPEILVQFSSPTSFTLTIDNAKKSFSSRLDNISDLWTVMQDVFAFIQINYNGDAKFEDIESVAIDGMLKVLDPHSALLTPEYYKEFKIDTGGEFGGLGIVISSKDGKLTVITPIEDTPAWKAGIKSGDVITRINSESTINMSLLKAVEKLRGKIGSKVLLAIERKGRPAPFELTLIRDNIQIESVKTKLLKEAEGDVGYIRIKRFQQETNEAFATALKKIKNESGAKLKGLIIDLRNNPGGLLNQAISIADIFLDEGVIVSTVGAYKKFIEEEVAHAEGTESKNYPVVVLVNEGSASASEIVAGALQALDRALVIGSQTFGKGSVQSVYDLGNNYALKLTVAQYLTAGKHSIQTTGVVPDITVVPITVDPKMVDLEPNSHSSEKELERHLTQIVPSSGKQSRIVKYYKNYLSEDQLEELNKSEYVDSLDFKDDFEVKLATKIILATRSAKPFEMEKEADAVIVGMEQLEQEKISAKLHEIGTNWDKGSEKGSERLSANQIIKVDNAPVDRAAAGKNADLVLTVTNSGEKTLYQLIGVIGSENFLIKDREFVFGKISPKGSQSSKISLEIPAGAFTQDIPFTVKFKEGGTPLSYAYKSVFKINELKHPQFSFNYELEKPRATSTSTPLPKGKNVPLIIKVKNVGDGPTKDAEVILSNKDNNEHIFIETGRAKLGLVKPAAIAPATLAFRVQPGFSSSTFTLELSIVDRDLLEMVTIDLDFTVESGSITPAPGMWYEGPKIVLNNITTPITTSSEKYTLRGTLIDDQIIKDYYIFVDDRKVAYASNPQESKDLSFDSTFSLKEGSNTVSIIARDNNKLMTRKTLSILRGTQK